MEYSNNKWSLAVLKALALFMPLYLVYYGPLHDHPESPGIRSLWKFTLFGFAAYAAALTAWSVF